MNNPNGEIAVPVVCANCRRPLDRAEDSAGNVSWQHPALQLDPTVDGHEPEPVVVGSHRDVVGACDFCSAPEVLWVYPCASFEIAEYGRGSDGAWGACGACHDSIEAGRWDVVTQRVVNGVEYASPQVRAALSDVIGALHQQFSRNRLGDAIAIEQLP